MHIRKDLCRYETVVREKDRALADQRSAWEDDSNKKKKEVAESCAEVGRLTQELARAMNRNEEGEERVVKREERREERISLTLGSEAYESILESAEAHRGSQGRGREEAVADLWKEGADSGASFEELQTDISSKGNDLEILRQKLKDRAKEVWNLVKELQRKVSYSRYLAYSFPVSYKILILKRSILLVYDSVAGHAS